MSGPDVYPLADSQNEELIRSLKNEFTSLKIQLEKKDDRIATLENMVNTTMTCLTAERHASRDVRNKLDTVIEMLRKRVLHLDILDFLKVKDSEEFQFRNLW
jgi:predicted RNase H-like nuclease (RuvC/YqgF family)